MSLLLPDSGLLFWMLLTFGIVFAILAKYGFPVIVKMVEERKQNIDQSLSAAKEAQIQISKLKETGEKIIADANREQGRILREAAEQRDKIIAEAHDKARLEGEKELESVRRQIRQEREDAILEIRSQVALLSVSIAEKVIRQKLSKDKEQTALIDTMIEEVLNAPK